MEDEAWRNGLEDGVAQPLLDWALTRTDVCLEGVAPGDRPGAAASGAPATSHPLPGASDAPSGARGAMAAPDAALAHDTHPTGGASSHLEDVADAAADQTRHILRTLAELWRGAPEDQVWRQLEPLLSPPLFATPDEGRAAVRQALAGAGRPQ